MFSRTLQFYLNAIKFESKMIIDGLNEDIESLKMEIDMIKELRLARIKSFVEYAHKITNALLEQGQKFEEL